MWQEQAEALFFMEKKSIKEISSMISKSEKSIREYFKKMSEYQKEKERRKIENQKKRKLYQKEWDRKNRSNRYSCINGDSLKREHDLAAMILSREKY